MSMPMVLSADICAKLDPDTTPSDWIDFCNQNSWPVGTDPSSGSNKACIAAGNQFQGPLDAKIKDIILGWNPPETFTGLQIRSAVAAANQVLDQAQAALVQAQQSSISPDLLDDVTSELREVARHKAQADLYLNSAAQADSSGSPVAAPNFKQWIVNAMNEASNAMVVAYTVGCVTPWWYGALSGFQAAFDQLYNIVKGIVGVVITVGQAVVNAVEGAATAIGLGAKLVKFVSSWWPALLLVTASGLYAYHRKKAYGRVFPEGLGKKVSGKLHLPFPKVPT